MNLSFTVQALSQSTSYLSILYTTKPEVRATTKKKNFQGQITQWTTGKISQVYLKIRNYPFYRSRFITFAFIKISPVLPWIVLKLTQPCTFVGGQVSVAWKTFLRWQYSAGEGKALFFHHLHQDPLYPETMHLQLTAHIFDM